MRMVTALLHRMATSRHLGVILLLATCAVEGWGGATAYAQNVGMGLLFDDSAYERAPGVPVLMRGDYDSLPARVSLKSHAPYAGNQQRTSMCVGWATGYAARTIIEARKNGWTDREFITKHAYAPAYIYNRLRDPAYDPNCARGSYLIWALDLLQDEGVAPLETFPTSCDRMPTPDDEFIAMDHKIIGYHKLFRTDTKKKIFPVKKSLSEGNPVVIGMNVTTSFLNSVHKSVWMPQDGEPADAGAHALAVIGYDDEMHGGAFEVMNSWGRRWGNEGFIWIPYEAFTEYVYYGFEVFGTFEQEDVAPIRLKSSLTLTLSNGEPMAATFQDDRYKVDQAFPSYTAFNAHITNESPAYVYAFGSDLTRAANRLIPHGEKTSAYIPYQKSSISLLPEGSFMALDDRTGTDYLTLLFSTVELNLNEIVQRVSVEDGSFMQRLKTVLGTQLVPAELVTYDENGSMGFEAVVQNGKMVALVVEIEHVALPTFTDTLAPDITLLHPSVQPGESGIARIEKPAHTTQIALSGTIREAGGLRNLTVAGRSAEVDTAGVFRFEIDIPTLPSDTLEISATDVAGNQSILTVLLATPTSSLRVPEITVVEPRVVPGNVRGGVPETARASQSVQVRGSVEHDGSISGVYVNGIAAEIEPDGHFRTSIWLPGDERRLRIEATDSYGNTSTESFYILDEKEDEDEIVSRAGYYSEEKKYIEVNVYYATDRKRTGSEQPAEFYGGERGELEYGKTVVSIPKSHRVGELESPAWWRFELTEDPSRHIILREVEPQPRDVFLRSLGLAVDRSGAQEAFVFVHGFNTSFESAARRTAQLAYDVGFDGAPIMYSWPSDGAALRYTSDETDAAWSVPNLEAFLKEVAQEAGARQIHVVAHSMGSRVLAGALTRIAYTESDPILGHIIFTAPDIDADIFGRDIAPLLPATATRATLYASSDDRALIASRKVHGYPRAGESGAGILVSKYVDTVDASGIDTDLIGHSYFAETELILRDIYSLVIDDLPPEGRKLIRAVKEMLSYWRLPYPAKVSSAK